MTAPPPSEPFAVSVDEVLITGELEKRPARTPDLTAENEALGILAQELAGNGAGVLQKLVDLARSLCGADSTGISILEPGHNGGVFRWHAIAGDLAANIGGSSPREASPCGIVLDRDRPLLFKDPARFFPESRNVEPPIHEALLVPFRVGGKPVGTLWAISQQEQHCFDKEDARILTSLSRFAGIAHSLLARQHGEEELRAARLAALNLMEDAIAAQGESERANAALRESETQLAQELEATQQLQKISGELIEGQQTDVLYEQILNAAIALMRADMGSLQMLDSDGKQLRLLAWKGFHPESAAYWETINFESGSACGAALRIGERLIIPDVRTAHILKGSDHHKHYKLSKITAIQSTPLISRDGRVVGMISTLWHKPHAPGERELRMFDVLARQAADVLERQRGEEMLRRSEEQFRRAIEDAPIPVIMHAEDGQVLQISHAWTELTGYSREDIPTFQAWLNRAYGPGAEDVRAHMRQLFDGHVRRLNVELDVSTRTGEMRHWAFSASAPGTLHDGRRFVVGMAVDITERARAAEALRESEKWLRTVADAVPQIIWTNTGNGVANWFNRRWHQYSGLSYEQSVDAGWEAIVHPEDAPTSKDRWERAQAAGEIFDSEYRLRAADGTYRWFIGRNVPLRGADRRVTGWFGTATDVQALKEAEAAVTKSEAQLQLVLENAREFAIFTADLNRCVTSWNRGAERVLGFAEAEILGNTADIIFTPEDRAAGAPETEAQQALDEGRGIDERWHIRKDGSRFWGSGAMMAMRNGGGEPVGLLKIFRDQTDAKHSAEALAHSRVELEAAFLEMQRAREEAEAANRTKDRFLAMLSHELRTPLTPLLGAAESILRQKDLSPRTVEGLHMICRNVELQTHLINDLLDLTRVSRGTLELNRQPVSLHEVLKTAVEVSLPDIEAKQQKLSVELNAKHHMVNADTARTQQVFWNLLKNASKFTPACGEVRVSSRNEEETIVIEISDTGIGMEEATLPVIFEAFRQADTSIARRFGGLGLGLAISKASIDAHGGSIEASSAGAGRGATFTVKFPLEKTQGE